MAILLVTVFVLEDETAVDAKIFPVAAGNVNTVEPDTAGACKVIVPLVSPAMTTELIAPPIFDLMLRLQIFHLLLLPAQQTLRYIPMKLCNLH